ncbi:MAG: DUF2207 domain-containing protein [Chloroflexi bacterium]|nr:DUF2207 domain-containing protein [Chloroflexota bacterium]
MSLTLSLLLLFVLPASILPARVLAQNKTLVWRRYDVDITVMPSGDMRVVETQEIEFLSGTFTQGYAVIPSLRTDEITDFSVREGDRVYRKTDSDTGAPPYTFYVLYGNGGVDWFFPKTGPSIHTYELAYTVKGGIPQYPAGDELQWKAVTSEHDFDVLASKITIHLPPGGLPIQGRIVAFSPAGIAWETPDQTTVVFTATRALHLNEGIEIGVAFKHGAIAAPPPQWQTAYDREKAKQDILNLISGLTTALALLAVPLGLFLLWYLAGRDPAVGVVPEYIAEPPSDLPPGVIGTLIDEKADTPDVVATLVDLARKGALTVEENAKPGEFGSVKRDYELKKLPMPDGLAPYEQTLYNALFGKQESRTVDSLAGSLYADFERIRKQLYEEVVKRGLFRANPETTRSLYRNVGIAGIFVFGIAGFCVIPLFGVEAAAFPCTAGVLVLGSIALMVLANRMPAKTRKGAGEAAKWGAFRTYLANIDKYRDLKEATDQFEKYLPYAIAFGLDRRWVTMFSKVEATPLPRWYVPRYAPWPMRDPGVGAPKTMAAPSAGGAAGVPSLSQVGQGMAGSLQSFSDGLVTMLNSTARTLNIQPASTTSGSYVGAGSRGYSGGSFRSFGGGFRSGGGGGGGARGFR